MPKEAFTDIRIYLALFATFVGTGIASHFSRQTERAREKSENYLTQILDGTVARAVRIFKNYLEQYNSVASEVSDQQESFSTQLAYNKQQVADFMDFAENGSERIGGGVDDDLGKIFQDTMKAQLKLNQSEARKRAKGEKSKALESRMEGLAQVNKIPAQRAQPTTQERAPSEQEATGPEAI